MAVVSGYKLKNLFEKQISYH